MIPILTDTYLLQTGLNIGNIVIGIHNSKLNEMNTAYIHNTTLSHTAVSDRNTNSKSSVATVIIVQLHPTKTSVAILK